MSTDTFIRCLKLLGEGCQESLSDNGKSFKAAVVFLKRVFKDQNVIDDLSALGTEWVFNIEKAPW